MTPVDPVPPAPPTTVPPIVMYVVASIAAAAGLVAGQGLIDNHVEKLVEGLASILIPLGWVLGNAIHHLAAARVTAAQTLASATRAAGGSFGHRPAGGGR